MLVLFDINLALDYIARRADAPLELLDEILQTAEPALAATSLPLLRHMLERSHPDAERELNAFVGQCRLLRPPANFEAEELFGHFDWDTCLLTATARRHEAVILTRDSQLTLLCENAHLPEAWPNLRAAAETPEKVDFLNPRRQYCRLAPALDAAYETFMDSGRYVLGGATTAFEDAWAEYTGAARAVGVSNGLDALTLALEICGVGPDDEVIVPANTYIATVLAVLRAGARPVFAEPDEASFNLSAAGVKAALTPKTKAIMPVHLYGRLCPMPDIIELAEEKGLWVIEDAAQAQGAEIDGVKAGAWGHLNAHSFYPGKNLGAFGEAGALTTNRDDFADKARALRNYGSRRKYYNEYAGGNHRIDELQAAFLLEKLPYLDEWNAARAQTAARYADRLAGAGDLALPEPGPGRHVWHQYVVRTKRREQLKTYLQAQGVGTVIHYPVPPHLQEALQPLGYAKAAFPLSEQLANEVLSLPMDPLAPAGTADRVAEITRAFFE